MKKTPIITSKAPGAIGPYSQGVSAGEFVFVSGQIPAGQDGALVPGGVAEQTERSLSNVLGVLLEAGLTMNDVVKTTVFMTDLGQFAAMNEVYAKHFHAPFPARATVQVSALPKGALVEIEAIAIRP
ncbi:MAG: reactive intermediate/imine deaminase [Elusimicrobia bacterium RIFOXYD12_FULL_66_9]|nr:MAG: reactive intermediate/imine deaminase [Elusimicrobia bacterium RIFOXYD12_FULL_66_9]